MSNMCVCHIEGEWCFYCVMYSPLEDKYREAQTEIERIKKDKRLLHVAYDAQYARATEYSANAQRLGEALHGLLNAIERGALVKQKMSAALDYDIRRAKEALLHATQENNGR